MKNRNWLSITEYLLVIGTGVGSVAASAAAVAGVAALQPILLPVAPMSVLFLLNLINRRRMVEAATAGAADSVSQLDHQVSTDIAALQQQVQALPSYLDLASVRKSVAGKNEESVNGLSQEIAQLKREMAKPEWRSLRQEVRQIQEQYTGVADSINSITAQLNRALGANRMDNVEGALAQLRAELSQLRVNLQSISDDQRIHNTRALQDQINHLNRRLNKLPTPFDASALKQDIDALVKMMGEMVSRRELARLVAQVEKLNQQSDSIEQTVTPLKVATAILKKQLDTISAKVITQEQAADQLLQTALLHPEPAIIDSLKATVTTLEQRINQLPASQDLSSLRTELQGLVTNQLGQLQQQVTSMQQFTQTLDRQQKTLRDWVNRLPQVLDNTAIQNEVKYLAARVEWAEGNTVDVQAEVEAAIKQQLGEVTAQLQASHPTPAYELIFDMKGTATNPQGLGRKVLTDVLDAAQARLIVVFPFPDPETFDPHLVQKFRDFLDRRGCLDVGWGHLGDMNNHLVPRSIDRRRALNANEKGFLYETLNQLTLLKQQYPDQFRFKVLGTSENFLVCDRSFAILGSQSVATASVVFPQAAVGLRTTDAAVIQGLVDRFDDPVLDANDATAYFNRAITRHDLGDRQGAIADYTEVLRIQPNNDIACNNRGLVRYDLNDLQGAIDDLQLAVQYNPENYVAYFNLGFIRAELGDKLGAIEDYTAALKANSDYATAYFYRGLARTRLQNKLGAIEDYTEVIRLNPQDATAYFYRGLAAIKIGHRLDAIKDLRQASQLFLEQGDTTNYQQTIRTLKKLHKTLVIEGANKPLVSNGAQVHPIG